MKHTKKLAALIAAFALGLALVAPAMAATGASDQGVTPSWHDGNITADGNGQSDAADCASGDVIETADTGGEATTDNGVTVTWTYDSDTKAVGFTATGGLVTIAYIKGGDAYNEYNYVDALGHGVSSDGNLFAPDNGSAGPAGLSHAVFCTGPGEESTPSIEVTPSFEQSQEAETDQPTEPSTDTIGSTGTSAPADGAWLLVVALGVLLASIVVLTPAKAKNRS
jgi:hypothetical protein